MEPLSYVERFFSALDALQARLSARWREHSNRRSLIVIIAAGTIAIVSYIYFIQPPAAFPVNELVTVSEGAPLTEIAAKLQNDGVVRSALAFRMFIIVLGKDRTLHAGDYLFKEPRDVFSVARAVSIGAFGLEPIRIRIAEGATTRSMAIIYQSNLVRFDTQRFLEIARPLEGYLFPDTYFFLPNATEDTVIKTMRQNFDIQTAPLAADIAASGRSMSDVVIMASIIEREAHKSKDRRMISGVLWNRIKRGMPLQVDVTFLYTIGKNTFQLTMKDLTTDSPYNTYMNKGLPPGAIGSPSLDSLDAAVHPDKNDYLYYLADNTGVTHFSKTYQEHLRKKRLYLGT